MGHRGYSSVVKMPINQIESWSPPNVLRLNNHDKKSSAKRYSQSAETTLFKYVSNTRGKLLDKANLS